MPKSARRFPEAALAHRSTSRKRRRERENEDNARPARRSRIPVHASPRRQEEARESSAPHSQRPLHNAEAASTTGQSNSLAGLSLDNVGNKERGKFERELRLLEQTTSILSEAAGYLSSSQDQTARLARRKAEGKWQRALPFHVEINTALLWLKDTLRLRGEELSAQHDKLSTLFGEALDLYEDLVAAQARNSGGHGAYAYLHLLHTEYEQHQRELREPKPLGYIRYLYCPSIRIRHRLIRQISLFEGSFNVILAEQERSCRITRILSAATSLKEWCPPSGLSKHVPLIGRALQYHRPCVCDQSHHQAHLSFSSSKDSDILGTYKICLSTDSESYVVATLHLLQAESPKAPDKGKKSSSKRVMFQRSHHAQFQTWIPCEGICEAFAEGPGNYALHTNEAQSRNLRCEVPQDSNFRLRSLRDIIKSGTLIELGALKRAILGALLTYTYLFTVKTPFWDNSEEEPDFWFREEIHTKDIDIRQIFLRCPDQSCVPSGTQNWPKALNRERPSLPALGKLLFEVWQGTACTWDALIKRHENHEGVNMLSHHWLLAIDNCLDQSEVLKDGGDIRDDPKLRSAFVNRVAKILQRMVEISEDCCFDEALQGGHTRTIAEAAAFELPNASCRFAEGASNDKHQVCLHDDEEQARASITGDAAIADTWQQNLSGLYDRLRLLPGANPVKIAVLDTGVSFANWTLYQHKIAEQRSWVGVEDEILGADLTGKNIDADGHGTHTTFVLLETSPSCEVYVAKVFSGRREKLGVTPIQATQQAIANAILYAVNTWKVDVISMSFGYANEVEVIENAIGEAARRNVAMFAAASNYGDNQQESWPARHPQVMCIHAADGMGNKYRRNPTPRMGNDNFSVLGVEVSGRWRDNTDKRKSGTSVATPIAAGIATIFIEFMRSMKTEYLELDGRRFSDAEYDYHVRRLTNYSKMRALFDAMTGEVRDGYCPIKPSILLEVALKEDKVYLTRQILRLISDA